MHYKYYIEHSHSEKVGFTFGMNRRLEIGKK